jgi:hypothetical protein
LLVVKRSMASFTRNVCVLFDWFLGNNFLALLSYIIGKRVARFLFLNNFRLFNQFAVGVGFSIIALPNEGLDRCSDWLMHNKSCSHLSGVTSCYDWLFVCSIFVGEAKTSSFFT